ncbi:MAG TPA: carbonate dehydratase [Parachlamydiales bacterium]|nr:carbonate dehydratase [Parachlamydiales bacterium]
MEKLKVLFQNNENWVETKIALDPAYFRKLARDQNPDYLWIGCSDSRVPANEVVGLEPGELLVHRNVANICPHTDFNCLSVLEFAINILNVRHVIVCGHYGCGGVKSAMKDHHLGLVDNWLRHIRDVYSRFKDELDAIENEKARCNRLVELNVIQQVQNVCHTTIVQEAWNRGQFLCVHGWVYDLQSGKLKGLNCCISSVDQVDSIYRVRSPKH